MPDDNKPDALAEAVANITSKVDEAMKSTDEKFGIMETKIDEIKDTEKPYDFSKPTDSHDDDEDQDTFMTRGEAKNLKKEIISETTESVKQVVSESLAEKTKKESKDAQAFSKYPYMDSNSELYNDKFAKAVYGEMERRVKSGKSKNDPDLINDSAATIYSEMAMSGDIVSLKTAKKQHQKTGAGDDNFDISGRGKDVPGKPSAKQIAIASQFGMKEKELTERFEKRGKS